MGKGGIFVFFLHLVDPSWGLEQCLAPNSASAVSVEGVNDFLAGLSGAQLAGLVGQETEQK